jgi:SAM-dependent methyltransferase
MVARQIYDLMYHWWAPWDAVGARAELRELLARGVVDPERHPRAIDLGCGTGANVVFLAEQGFQAVGVDFSRVALDKARRRAADAGVSSRCRFVEADLTASSGTVADGPFDLLLDFGAIDDLRARGRPAAARLAGALSRRGSRFLFWCFYGDRRDLPRFSFHGPSKLAPGISPGEEQQLFGDAFDIEPFMETGVPGAACFLLTRKATVPATPEGTAS